MKQAAHGPSRGLLTFATCATRAMSRAYSNLEYKNAHLSVGTLKENVMNLAERTGLEPATPGVTGRYSNQLNYRSSGRRV